MNITKENKNLLALYGLAMIFWILIFAFKVINFWLGMSIASTFLTILSFKVNGVPIKREEFTLKAFAIGLISAGILYVIFYIGNEVANIIFPFAKSQVLDIYEIQTQAQLIVISLVLFCITSPAEELFWRGYLQSKTVGKYGFLMGNIVSACMYSFVHLWSGNIMLTLAALVAGLFWSFMYSYTKNLFACIVSHAFWTVSVFVLFPIV